VDAFAGAGRYESGEPASPMLAMQLASEAAQWRPPVDLDCLFVEKEREVYEKLTKVVPPERARLGTIEAHLPEVLARADNQPLFMFIDPFGQPIPFNELVGKVLARPRGYGLATEVLLNFSITALQRNAGRLLQTAEPAHAEAVLRRFDQAMGGPWWQDRGPTLTRESGATDSERQEVELSVVT
jgi:three-Cys-motif partner protein